METLWRVVDGEKVIVNGKEYHVTKDLAQNGDRILLFLCTDGVFFIDEDYQHHELFLYQSGAALSPKIVSDHEQSSESKARRYIPVFADYDFETKKGRTLRDIIIILSSIGATKEQILKVVLTNCGLCPAQQA